MALAGETTALPWKERGKLPALPGLRASVFAFAPTRQKSCQLGSPRSFIMTERAGRPNTVPRLRFLPFIPSCQCRTMSMNIRLRQRGRGGSAYAQNGLRRDRLMRRMTYQRAGDYTVRIYAVKCGMKKFLTTQENPKVESRNPKEIRSLNTEKGARDCRVNQ